jgi:predicted Rossmann fold nucleotide-binding protein DprA/Smf involved in DNA uptake
MALKTEQIVKLLQLKGIVNKTALMICEMTRNETIGNDSDFLEFFLRSKVNNKFQGFPSYSEAEINCAIEKGNKIIEESDKCDIKIISLYDKDYPSPFKLLTDKPVILSPL